MNDFVVQLIRRFLAQTPWFHKVLRGVSIVVAVIAALPQFMDAAGLYEILPGTATDIVTKIVGIAAVVSALVAQLAVTEEAKDEAAKIGKPIK